MATTVVIVSFDKIATHLPSFECRHNVVIGARQLHAVFERIQMSRDIFESCVHPSQTDPVFV